jgi:hypothetical protein
MSEEHTKLEDKSRDHAYFLMVPHIVHHLCRNTYDLALWIVVKMVAGEKPSGECYLATQELADFAMMSAGQVHDSRQYLLSVGLLTGEIKKDPGPYNPVWHLTVPDLWEKNIKWRQANERLLERIELKRRQKRAIKAHREAGRAKKADSPCESDSPSEKPPTPDELKKNQQGEPKTTTTLATNGKLSQTESAGVNAAGGVLSSQQKARAVLEAAGFRPPNDMVRYSNEHSLSDIVGWVVEGCERDDVRRLGGWLRTMFDGGGKPPTVDWQRMRRGAYNASIDTNLRGKVVVFGKLYEVSDGDPIEVVTDGDGHQRFGNVSNIVEHGAVIRALLAKPDDQRVKLTPEEKERLGKPTPEENRTLREMRERHDDLNEIDDVILAAVIDMARKKRDGRG